MDINNTLNMQPNINSYHDFSGLAQLKAQSQVNIGDDKSLKMAAQQFEATLIQEMMRSMRQASMKSDLLESNDVETFEGMFDKEVAMQISKKGGIGLADTLVKYMKVEKTDPSGHDKVNKDAQGTRSTHENYRPYEITNNRLFPLNHGSNFPVNLD